MKMYPEKEVLESQIFPVPDFAFWLPDSRQAFSTKCSQHDALCCQRPNNRDKQPWTEEASQTNSKNTSFFQLAYLKYFCHSDGMLNSIITYVFSSLYLCGCICTMLIYVHIFLLIYRNICLYALYFPTSYFPEYKVKVTNCILYHFFLSHLDNLWISIWLKMQQAQ